MDIIYAVLVLFSIVLLGANIDIILSLSYDLGDVIKGRLNRQFFIKKVILGVVICLLCTFMAVILTGKFGLTFNAIIFGLSSPLVFLIGLVSSLTGQQLNQSRILDLVIYLIITRNRKRDK